MKKIITRSATILVLVLVVILALHLNARRNEKKAYYTTVESPSVSQCEEYLTKYPSGKWTPKVKELLIEARKKEAEEEKERKRLENIRLAKEEAFSISKLSSREVQNKFSIESIGSTSYYGRPSEEMLLTSDSSREIEVKTSGSRTGVVISGAVSNPLNHHAITLTLSYFFETESDEDRDGDVTFKYPRTLKSGIIRDIKVAPRQRLYFKQYVETRTSGKPSGFGGGIFGALGGRSPVLGTGIDSDTLDVKIKEIFCNGLNILNKEENTTLKHLEPFELSKGLFKNTKLELLSMISNVPIVGVQKAIMRESNFEEDEIYLTWSFGVGDMQVDRLRKVSESRYSGDRGSIVFLSTPEIVGREKNVLHHKIADYITTVGDDFEFIIHQPRNAQGLEEVLRGTSRQTALDSANRRMYEAIKEHYEEATGREWKTGEQYGDQDE